MNQQRNTSTLCKLIVQGFFLSCRVGRWKDCREAQLMGVATDKRWLEWINGRNGQMVGEL